MREYDEAVRLHNYDKFNHSPSFQSNPTANNRGRGGGGMGAMMVDQGGPARSLTGGDLSKVQELELAQFLHQRDAVSFPFLIEISQGINSDLIQPINLIPFLLFSCRSFCT